MIYWAWLQAVGMLLGGLFAVALGDYWRAVRVIAIAAREHLPERARERRLSFGGLRALTGLCSFIGVVSILGKNMMGDTAFTQVLGYTIFHYAAFFIVGILLTVIVHQAERTPGILAGLLVAFVMMTLGFYMIAAVFTQSALGGMSWAQIFIANLLASSLMLWYLWRKHPRLEHHLKRALEGTDD